MTLPIDTNQIIIIALSVLLVIVLGVLIRLEIKLRRLCRGAKGADLESAINALGKDITSLRGFEKESKEYFKNVEKRLRRSTQASETVRFNAFGGNGLGGNQSFATALINENGDGTIVSSLYSRERVSVFSKPINKFGSEIELTEEERSAIAAAQKKLSA